jgi:hypothetical protein
MGAAWRVLFRLVTVLSPEGKDERGPHGVAGVHGVAGRFSGYPGAGVFDAGKGSWDRIVPAMGEER